MILINPFFGQSCATSVSGTSTTYGTQSSIDTIIPHYGLYEYTWTAWIMTQAEIGSAKQITGLGYIPTGYTTPYAFPNQTIRMAHVVQSSWASTTPQVNLSDLTLSGLKTVRSSFTDNITANNVVQRINFDSNFCYNGTSNLLIIWDNRRGTWSSGQGFAGHIVGNGQGAWAYNSAAYPTGTGSRQDTKPRTTLYY